MHSSWARPARVGFESAGNERFWDSWSLEPGCPASDRPYAYSGACDDSSTEGDAPTDAPDDATIDIPSDIPDVP